MPKTKKTTQRGGSASAKAKGLIGVVVHLTPDEHERFREEAFRRRLAIKHTIKTLALEGLPEKPE